MIKKAVSKSGASESDSSKSSIKPKNEAKSKKGDKNAKNSKESAKPVGRKEKGKIIEKLEETKEDYEVKDGCVFCGILKGRKVPILYEDKYCFAFYDKKKKSAKEHILMCPKDHIKNIHTVTERDVKLLKHIQNSGEALLKQMFPKEQFRFGYHEPPTNSMDHLHLHCIVLPITQQFYDTMLYGIQLSPTSKFITKFERVAALRKAAAQGPVEPEEIKDVLETEKAV